MIVLIVHRFCYSWCIRALQYYMEFHEGKNIQSSSSMFTSAVHSSDRIEWPAGLMTSIESRIAASQNSAKPCSMLPLSGFVPDMTSSTAYFVELQKVHVAVLDCVLYHCILLTQSLLHPRYILYKHRMINPCSCKYYIPFYRYLSCKKILIYRLIHNY